MLHFKYSDDNKKEEDYKEKDQRKLSILTCMLLALGVFVILGAIFFFVRFFTDDTKVTVPTESVVVSKEVQVASSSDVGETKGEDSIALGDLSIDSAKATFQILEKDDSLKEKVYSHVQVEEGGMVCDIYWDRREVKDSNLDILLVAAGELYEQKLNEGLNKRRYNVVTNRPELEDLKKLGSSTFYDVDKDFNLHLISRVTIKDLSEESAETKAVEFVLRYGEKYLELK